MKTKDVVLVLTNSADGSHTDVVLAKLKDRGETIFRFDSDKLQRGEPTIEFSVENGLSSFQFNSNGNTIESHNIKSVWYRRPNHFALNISDTVQKKFAEEETRYALEGIWLSIPNAFWLSRPDSIERARKKLFQLSLACRVGFTIPRTLVTNDPEKAMSFFESCHGKMIFKTIKQGFLGYGDKGFNIPTTLIERKHLDQIKLVKCPPCLFQEYVDKFYELRVTIVGNKVFPVRIDSQLHQETLVDWRNPAFMDKLNYRVVALPENILTLCMEMMRELGLEFGAFDLAVDKKGQFVFFEVNPNGQWYWLEHYAGACISDAITDILSVGRS